MGKLILFFKPKVTNFAQPPAPAAYASKQNQFNGATLSPQESTEMITKAEILMGRIAEKDLPADLAANLDKLHKAINKLRAAYGKPMIVSSGYRSPEQNAAAKGAKKSNHMACLAADFHDADGKLDEWCMANLPILEECGIFLEHPEATKNWTHVQVVAPKSGNRVFRP